MESSAIARYQGFFGEYRQVKHDAADAYRKTIAQFMGQVAPFVQRQKEVRRQIAPRFNLFEALGIARQEQSQSRFLAFLLDPAESHDQGDLFLRTFLEHILPEMVSPRLDGATVKLESGIATYGRVDLAITLPDGRIIVIENKVDASEGEEQIARYQAWLREQRQPTNGQHLLVFLTPEGRKPQTGDPDADVLCVSYGQLGTWVSSLPTLPERLCTVLTQYGENCHSISGDRRYGMAMDDELRAFLTDPQNLGTAFEVAEAVEAIRPKIFTKFWELVKRHLSAELERHGYQEQWEARSDDNIFGRWSKVGIYRRRGGPQFVVVFECLTGAPDSAYYGIHRGRSIQAQNRDVRDQALSAQLAVKGFGRNDWWAGWRYLHDLGLPKFRITEKEDVLTLNKDNSDPNHPLAHRLVSLLWDLFAKHREALEALNTDYPYS